MRVLLTFLPITSLRLYLQSLSTPDASGAASDGAAGALSLKSLLGREEDDDSGLVYIALVAAGNK
jgi:hypothetical protein